MAVGISLNSYLLAFFRVMILDLDINVDKISPTIMASVLSRCSFFIHACCFQSTYSCTNKFSKHLALLIANSMGPVEVAYPRHNQPTDYSFYKSTPENMPYHLPEGWQPPTFKSQDFNSPPESYTQNMSLKVKLDRNCRLSFPSTRELRHVWSGSPQPLLSRAPHCLPYTNPRQSTHVHAFLLSPNLY